MTNAERSRVHTMRHALYPEHCTCTSADIIECVLCGRPISQYDGREHFDTCGGRCFKRLLHLQRTNGAGESL